MSGIHPTALVAAGAQIDTSASVGPFSIIEAGANIGPGNQIDAHVRIYGAVRLGANNRVGQGTVLGGEPNDLGFTADKSRPLLIGDNNVFKECVNISRGTKTDEGSIIGNNNYFMNGFHAGHDCRFGDHNVFGPNSAIGGHVELGNRVFISGLVAVHQFVRIGDFVMAAGCSKIVKDVPPYVLIDGNPATLVGLNSVGLRRSGFDSATRTAIKAVYHVLFHAGLNISQALVALDQQRLSVETQHIKDFFKHSQRGVTAHR
jgi:UDP-N-acetylglucosamine acyltransferase